MSDELHNDGKWTEARKRAFIISALRKTTSRWGPKNTAKGRARIERGVYRCAECGRSMTATEWGTYKSGKKKGQPKRIKLPQMDHIVPVVDPAVGFVDWNQYIERLLVEADHWRALCWQCHDKVTAEERAVRTERERREKNE